MYINNIRLSEAKIKNKILFAIGSIIFIMFSGSIIVQISEDSSNYGMIIFFITSLLIGIFIIYKALKLRALVESVYFYSRYFEGDLDGYINTKDMVGVIGKDENKINKELSKLLKEKYMINFILKQNNNGLQVVLESKIAQCKCNNCGAIIDKRIYFTGICPYCKGSDLYAKLIK